MSDERMSNERMSNEQMSNERMSEYPALHLEKKKKTFKRRTWETKSFLLLQNVKMSLAKFPPPPGKIAKKKLRRGGEDSWRGGRGGGEYGNRYR